MRVVVASESRFARTPDGRVWTRSGPGYSVWARYLMAFDAVRIVARVRDVASLPDGAYSVDGPDVEVWPMPYYQGPRQYLMKRRSIRRAVTAAVGPHDAYILRVPGQIASVLSDELRRRRQPYALEVIGDPYEEFARGAADHPLRPVFRRVFTSRMVEQCRFAAAASYVTEASLQSKYPVRAGVPAIACSDVDLAPAAYAPSSRPASVFQGAHRLVSVGMLEQQSKGVDVLIAAVARLAASRPALHLVHVGDGRLRPQLERMAADLGISGRITFAGALPAGDAVRDKLDAGDLFVMPSRIEGLPRALVEAMARALPAIGSAAGGIPEVLPRHALVPPGDPARLAESIDRMLADPERMSKESARNLARAGDFSAEILQASWRRFYEAVRDVSLRPASTVANKV